MAAEKKVCKTAGCASPEILIQANGHCTKCNAKETSQFRKGTTAFVDEPSNLIGASQANPSLLPLATPAISEDDDIHLEGWIWKGTSKGPFAKFTLRKRWFVLKDKKMVYAESPESSSKGSIDVTKIAKRGPLEEVADKWGFALQIPGREYYLWAATLEEKQKWCSALDKLGVPSVSLSFHGMATVTLKDAVLEQ